MPPVTDLKVALLPHDIVAYDIKANLDIVGSRISDLEPDTDLVVLPEMFSTGFTPLPEVLCRIAEPNDGPTITTVVQWAMQYNVHIWGSFTAGEHNNYFNRGFMANPDGEIRFYDKRHLFSYGGESRVLTPGNSLAPIINVNGWNVKMAICYDIRFPVWNRARGNDYDILVVPANWVQSRFFAWKHLLIARAIENQCFVLGCNREGVDVYGEYRRGDSMILNNWGDDISDHRSDGTAYSILNAEKFNIDRLKFAPWRDADDFQLTID